MVQKKYKISTKAVRAISPDEFALLNRFLDAFLQRVLDNCGL